MPSPLMDHGTACLFGEIETWPAAWRHARKPILTIYGLHLLRIRTVASQVPQCREWSGGSKGCKRRNAGLQQRDCQLPATGTSKLRRLWPWIFDSSWSICNSRRHKLNAMFPSVLAVPRSALKDIDSLHEAGRKARG